MSDRGKSTHPIIPNDREGAPLSGDSPQASDAATPVPESTSYESVRDGLQAYQLLHPNSRPSGWLTQQVLAGRGGTDLNTTGRIPVTQIEFDSSTRTRKREQNREAQRAFKKKLKEKLQDGNYSEVPPTEGSVPSSPDQKPDAGDTAFSERSFPANDSPSVPPTNSRFLSIQSLLQQEPTNSRTSSSENARDSLASGTPGHADSPWAHDSGPRSQQSTGTTSNLPSNSLSQAERDESGTGSHN